MPPALISHGRDAGSWPSQQSGGYSVTGKHRTARRTERTLLTSLLTVGGWLALLSWLSRYRKKRYFLEFFLS